MTINEYLRKILASQDLEEAGDELTALRAHRKSVDDLLKAKYSSPAPVIRYGGSYAKGTMIRECYDLDIICYFLCDDDSAGANLNEIYDNVANTLAASYQVNRRTSALRLKSRELSNYGTDFHIDVVPGRYSDTSKGDCYIFQSSADKCRLKTNLDVHLAHVRDSGVVPTIRLLKLWKTRRALPLKQFIFELLIIQELKGSKGLALEDQLLHVWETIRDASGPIFVEDPANPQGNDLSALVEAAWGQLSGAAAVALNQIKNSGWDAVFGPVDGEEDRLESLKRAAAAVTQPTKPWSME